MIEAFLNDVGRTALVLQQRSEWELGLEPLALPLMLEIHEQVVLGLVVRRQLVTADALQLKLEKIYDPSVLVLIQLAPVV